MRQPRPACPPSSGLSPPLEAVEESASADVSMSAPDTETSPDWTPPVQSEPALFQFLNSRPHVAAGKADRPLVWANVVVLGKQAWMLVDSGSVTNIVSQRYYESLQPRPPLLKPDPAEKLISGHNAALPLLGHIELPFTHNDRTYYHAFRVIPNFPVSLCLGAEFLFAHACGITYDTKPEFDVRRPTCPQCERFASAQATTVSKSHQPLVHPVLDQETVDALAASADPVFPMVEYCVPGNKRAFELFRQRGIPFCRPPQDLSCTDPRDPRFCHVRISYHNDPTPDDEVRLGEARCCDPYPPPTSPAQLAVLGELSLYQSNLQPSERFRLESVLRANSAAFALDDFDLGKTPLIEHEIDTQGLPPFKIKCRPIPFKAMTWLKDEIARLLTTGVIRPSKSPYSSPIVIVPKKSEPGEPPKFRLCIDYRWLNEQTKKDAYPIPRIQELMSRLAKARYFSSLDLVSGYHQVPMAKDSIEKSAFSTPFGHFEYVSMPFGLTNAPATFQRLMNRLFEDRLENDILVYLDDIVIFSETYEDHLASLNMALERLRKAGLKCQPRKCQLFRKSLTYLGHTVSTAGIAPETRKLDVLARWPLPKTGNEMLSYLGFCNYYRALVPRFADLAVPLYPLGQVQQIEWTADLRASFEDLRKALIRAPVLRLPDPNRPFLLETDASSVAVGAVLKQTDGKTEWPTGFFSTALSKPERNYSTYERELLALVKAVSYFAVYLLYSEFTWRTDHAALRNLFRADLKLSSRVSRWILSLQPYRVSIELLKGKYNTIADALSRINAEGLQWTMVEPPHSKVEFGYGTL